MRKYIVPSDEIPKAILNIKIVDGLNRIPKNPMIPAVIANGIRQGSFDKMIMRNERNNAIPTIVISRISMSKLSKRFSSK